MGHFAMLAVAAALAVLAPGPATARDALAAEQPTGTLSAVAAGARGSSAVSRVIVQTDDEEAAGTLVAVLGGKTNRWLPHLDVLIADLPRAQLDVLRKAPVVRSVSMDRGMEATLDRTSATVGARWVHETLGFDGTGIGVAIIDSGVTPAHDDLDPSGIVHFADFVNLRTRPHDGYGHGTHVAGIIAATGHSSGGARRGIAPGAHLVVLKALDQDGHGQISDAIAAIDYAIAHREVYNIRVINLSVAAGVYESYTTDPLTLAARRAVDAGIVVVTAAGNLGRDANGQLQHGGITAPGNAPWVLTVGAADHHGTAARSDDTIAPFSSLGPSSIDAVGKPDLVAPGVGIESLAESGSTLFMTRPTARVWGTALTPQEPYLSLSGTSMAAPVVAGTVALMLQVNPGLSPGGVKAILRTTADPVAAQSPLVQGAGLLNARLAVELALALVSNPEAADDLEATIAGHVPDGGVAAGGCGPLGVDCMTPLALRPLDD